MRGRPASLWRIMVLVLLRVIGMRRVVVLVMLRWHVRVVAVVLRWRVAWVAWMVVWRWRWVMLQRTSWSSPLMRTRRAARGPCPVSIVVKVVQRWLSISGDSLSLGWVKSPSCLGRL